MHKTIFLLFAILLVIYFTSSSEHFSNSPHSTHSGGSHVGSGHVGHTNITGHIGNHHVNNSHYGGYINPKHNLYKRNFNYNFGNNYPVIYNNTYDYPLLYNYPLYDDDDLGHSHDHDCETENKYQN